LGELKDVASEDLLEVVFSEKALKIVEELKSFFIWDG
jgi:hypothetical protein